MTVLFFFLAVTCTLDSLRDETPHEVGAVLTPVRAPEGMNLEMGEITKFKTTISFLQIHELREQFKQSV